MVRHSAARRPGDWLLDTYYGIVGPLVVEEPVLVEPHLGYAHGVALHRVQAALGHVPLVGAGGAEDVAHMATRVDLQRAAAHPNLNQSHPITS